MSSVQELWKTNFLFSGDYPDATIIIPAFGAHEMTADCLLWLDRSLRTCESSCEVLLVDDASEVSFKKVFGEVQGLRIIRNETNLGFLGSCKFAASLSQGKDIVLLNNDTFPIGRWVDHMRDRLHNTPGALVVGARLVGLDGLLQESGGVIFSDASGWNFGRGWAADDPRCTYAREVDYCSGAALLVEGQFAREVGLFDRRFTPAYYEDTDLCFEARERGGSVWVEPKAVVIHREGASHGTDMLVGVKKYQEVNRLKFEEKWRKHLWDQLPKDAKNVWKARTRGAKPRVLVVDEEVPRKDAQAGALRMFTFLRLLRELNFEVTFLPRNGRRLEPYVTDLEALGVEVLGSIESYWDYVLAMKDQFVAVWVSRVGVLQELYSAFARDLPKVPIVFDTVDMHHVREAREAVLTGSARMGTPSEASELKYLRISDAVVVVSEVEAVYARKLTERPVFVVSTIHEPIDHIRFPPRSVSGVFVGSFRHSPNEDGIVWFIDHVMPLVIESEPTFELHVVGECPPASLMSRQAQNIIIHGWIPELAQKLRGMRLSLAPLRFGAGVKGKISQALSLGLPVVTTPIGAEGMNLQTGINAMVCEEPRDFATAVVRLLREDDFWRTLSLNGITTAQRDYGLDTAREQIRKVLSSSGRK
jgi:GT2 family glycosyltransferase